MHSLPLPQASAADQPQSASHRAAQEAFWSLASEVGPELAVLEETLSLLGLAHGANSPDTEDLARLLRERLKNVPNVANTKTTIVLQTIKETTALPIEESVKTEEKPKRREKKS